MSLHQRTWFRKSAFALAVVVISGALGLSMPGRALADDPPPKWKCSASENQCLPGSRTICQVGCTPTGCECDAWDPKDEE